MKCDVYPEATRPTKILH